MELEMPGLTSSFLPDELDGLVDLKDEDINVKITNDSLTNDDDGPVLEPKSMARKGQNEDEGDEPSNEDTDNPHIRESVAREARITAGRDRALKDLEDADKALLNSEKQKLAVQRDAFKMAKDNLDVRIRTSSEALKAARAEGDIGASTDIEQQLAEFRALRTQVEQNEARLPHESQLDQAYQEHVGRRRASYAEQDKDSGSRPLNDKAGKWADQNAAWFNRDQKAMAALHAINDSLAAEGFDPKGDEFFTELTRRMQKAHPGLGIRDTVGRAQPSRGGSQAKGPPVAGARAAGTGTKSDGQVGKNGKVNVNVNLDDVKLMRKLGLDPANEKHKTRFARERGQRLLNEAQNG
jgi:hypothetical protein